jgi:diguanylate cyclase (GGDEF)-like protein
MELVTEKRVLDMMSNHGNSVFYYWDCIKNTWWVKNGNFTGLNLVSDSYNPLETLIATGQLVGESHFVYNRYYQRILNGTRTPMKADCLSVTFRVPGEDGRDRIFTFTTYFNKNESGHIIEMAGEGREFTGQEIMDHNILSHFTSDRNPSVFYDRVEQLMLKNPNSKFAFIQFDIECFKMVNDRYGTEIGDRVLAFISDMLAVLCNADSAYMRMNADIFMVVMRYREAEEITDFISTLDFNLSWYEGIEYKLVYGISMLEDRSGYYDIRELIDSASLARQSIKGNELKNVAVFKQNLKHDIEHRKNMGAKLRHALENREFVMYLQPKFDIETETLTGAEALLRWNHPEAGIIQPDQFLGVLESNGLILNVDKFIWEQACITLRRWIDRGKRVYPISVNVSRAYIDTENVVDYLKMLVRKYEIPVHLLEIEITETVDGGASSDIVNELKENGFTMLMDDFGSGYSSLTVLRSTPFDILKLDKDFLSEFMENDRGKKILSHTIAMSRDMGLRLVAEGVETREQAEFLQECGCTTAQGYYYAEPMTVEQFEQLMH